MSLLSRIFGKKPRVSTPEATPEIVSLGYEIIVKDGQRAITCLRCKMTSWSRGDVDHLYCGNCHVFHARKKF